MRKVSLAALVLVGLAGCGVPDYATRSNAPVLLLVAGISPEIIQSNVTPATTRLPTADTATVNIAVRSTNQNVTVPTPALAVLMERYEIRYLRSDGRNTEGVDVPYRITGAMNGSINAETSGATPFLLEVVRAQAKLEPPLRNLRGASPDTPGGSAVVITMFADITVHGRTVAGQAVQSNGRVQIDFADFS